MDNTPPPEDDVTGDEERSEEDSRSRALVPVGRRVRVSDADKRVVAALCYFAWLGYLTAPLPLLLLRLRGYRNARGIPYHLYASAGWSIAVAVLRIILNGVAATLAARSGGHFEDAANVINMLHLVIVLAFALLLSCVYGIEALLLRKVNIPWVSAWAEKRAEELQ
ncbi:MAG: hypothetical protein GX131_02925 [candidate division WS1 bacterium]|jgi:hypothetical protein|nr:hypothetical protein [candidate division WS1 bacterium]